VRKRRNATRAGKKETIPIPGYLREFKRGVKPLLVKKVPLFEALKPKYFPKVLCQRQTYAIKAKCTERG
jgi:hypothetical protein